MKQSILLIAIALSVFTACQRVSTEPESPSAFTPPGVFVVNEGNFTTGNASLTWFQTDKKTLVPDAFYSVNKVPLGDVANFMTIRNGKGYVVVNNSGVVYVIDIKTGNFLDKISNLTSPRELLFVDDSTAWISDLNNTYITVVNADNYEVKGHIDLNGRTSESMKKIGDTVFVANWSKLNQQFNNDKILVVDIAKNMVVDSIQVELEPNSMAVDKDGKLWVLCSGGFMNEIFPALYRINPKIPSIEQKFEFPDKNSNPHDLTINNDGDNLYFLNGGVFKMNILSNEIPDEALVNNSSNNFYSIGVSPDKEELFVSDALDYIRNGQIYIYDKSGNLTGKFEAGIIPGYFAFYFE